jgi:hypothetical protein
MDPALVFITFVLPRECSYESRTGCDSAKKRDPEHMFGVMVAAKIGQASEMCAAVCVGANERVLVQFAKCG